MRRTMPLTRRVTLAGLGTSAFVPLRAGHAEPVPTLLVAGPAGGRLDRWANVLAAPIGLGMPGQAPLPVQNVGGLDGVTGANQFEARSELDGSAALLVPGSAALSWLVGESRAKFDPSRWVPLWAGAGSAALLSRVALAPGRRLKVAASGPAGPEMAALLTLDLLGVDAVLSTVQGADAVFLQGAALAAALGSAAGRGMQPVFTLGLPGSDGEDGRDPLLPTVPTAQELVRDRAPASMLGAVRAASLAVQLDAGLVLPQLTPAAAVAVWRRACTPLMHDPNVLGEAARVGTRLIGASAASACTNRLAEDVGALLSLRRWLAARWDWRPA